MREDNYNLGFQATGDDGRAYYKLQRGDSSTSVFATSLPEKGGKYEYLLSGLVINIRQVKEAVFVNETRTATITFKDGMKLSISDRNPDWLFPNLAATSAYFISKEYVSWSGDVPTLTENQHFHADGGVLQEGMYSIS